jgi:aspartate aminotransferase
MTLREKTLRAQDTDICELLRSERVKKLSISPTIAISERARALKQAGFDVLNLSVGEPDFETPRFIIDAAHEAALNGETRYTAPDGNAKVKSAVSEKLQRENGVEYATAEIAVVSGCKQAIFDAFAATLNEGDEVVIFSPYWVSYVDMVTFFSAAPKIVETNIENGFIPTNEDISAAVSSKTKWILINSPSNPTGALLPADTLKHIAKTVQDHPQAMVMSDEIYERIIYDDEKHVSILSVSPEVKDRVLIINGVSKSFAMTGWRIGYAAGPSWLISDIAKIQSQAAGSTNSIAQAAAAAAMIEDQPIVAERTKILEKRRDLVARELGVCDKLGFVLPKGAFYFFLDVSALIGKKTNDGRKLVNDRDVASFFLDEALVAAVPGTEFGMSPFIRLSFAVSEPELQRACSNIVVACEALGE